LHDSRKGAVIRVVLVLVIVATSVNDSSVSRAVPTSFARGDLRSSSSAA
jgi:hypothetical protein